MRGIIMDKILSISVAAYNVASTIEQCLDSFIASKHTDKFEVIVVNDGSQDNTADIVNNYVKKYPGTIRLINKQNGGHGSTINASINQANGKFFKIVDGDDWVDTAAFDKLLAFLSNCDADLVISNYTKAYPDHHEPQNLLDKYKLNTLYNLNEFPLNRFYPIHALTIKTDTYKSIHPHISEHCFYVDLEFLTFNILSAQTLQFYPEYVYEYRLGSSEQSVSTMGFYKHIEDLTKVITRLLAIYAQDFGYKINSNSSKAQYLFHIISSQYTTLFKLFIRFHKSDKDYVLEDFDRKMRRTYPNLVNAINLKQRKYIRLNYPFMLSLMRFFHK